ncbi:MAG: hypothetical protein AB7N76_32280 [Planctomycetota bacterium]
MPTLRDHLLGNDRQRVVSDTVRLVDHEMDRKSGLRAIPLKAGYKLVKGFKPGFVPAVVDGMLPEFCDALEPFFQEWLGRGDARGTLEAALKRDETRVAEALLGVADRRVRNANVPGAGAIQKAYNSLRGTARGHVIDALPGLGRVVQPFLGQV